jgi:hypothetical protein
MVTIRTIDKFMGQQVTLIDTHGVSSVVRIISRERSYVEYRQDDGHVGKLHRDDIAALQHTKIA